MRLRLFLASDGWRGGSSLRTTIARSARAAVVDASVMPDSRSLYSMPYIHMQSLFPILVHVPALTGPRASDLDIRTAAQLPDMH